MQFGIKSESDLRLSAAFFDVVFTSFLLTPRHDHDTLVVQCRNDIFPFGDLFKTGEVQLLSALEHIVLDRFKQLRNGSGEIGERNRSLYPSIATDTESLLLLHIGGADLKTEGNTLGSSSLAPDLRFTGAQ